MPVQAHPVARDQTDSERQQLGRGSIDGLGRLCEHERNRQCHLRKHFPQVRSGDKRPRATGKPSSAEFR